MKQKNSITENIVYFLAIAFIPLLVFVPQPEVSAMFTYISLAVAAPIALVMLSFTISFLRGKWLVCVYAVLSVALAYLITGNIFLSVVPVISYFPAAMALNIALKKDKQISAALFSAVLATIIGYILLAVIYVYVRTKGLDVAAIKQAFAPAVNNYNNYFANLENFYSQNENFKGYTDIFRQIKTLIDNSIILQLPSLIIQWIILQTFVALLAAKNILKTKGVENLPDFTKLRFSKSAVIAFLISFIIASFFSNPDMALAAAYLFNVLNAMFYCFGVISIFWVFNNIKFVSKYKSWSVWLVIIASVLGGITFLAAIGAFDTLFGIREKLKDREEQGI